MQHNGDPTLTSNSKFHAIKVKVTPKEPVSPSGEVPCDVSAPGGGNGWKVEHNKIELDPTEGPFCIQFDLDKSLDWASDPIWIQKDSCPMSSCSEPDQVWVDKTPEKGVLTIMNMNVGNRCQLHYRLNFTGDRYFDPIIENGGGNNFE